MTNDQADDDLTNAILQNAMSEGKTVWIYIDTAREVGDEDHLKVFASEEAAERWFAEHDPEGVVFEYPVMD